MTDWHLGDDEDEAGGEESLADTEADATEEQRGAEPLSDTEAEITLVQEDRLGDEG
jgi:hypothetical protein